MKINNIKAKRYYHKGIKTNYVALANGEIYNTKTDNFLKPYITTSGRYRVCLSINGNSKAIDTHKIVYEAFYGPVPEGMTINHINENKLDNRPENLNLLSRSDNIRSYLNNNKDALETKYPDELIHMVCKELADGLYYRDVALKYNIPIDYLYSIVKAKRRKKIVKDYLPFPESAYRVRETRELPTDLIDSLILQDYSTSEILDELDLIKNRSNLAIISRRRKELNKKDPKYFDSEFVQLVENLIIGGKSNKEIYKELGMEYSNRLAYLISRIRTRTGLGDFNPTGIPLSVQDQIIDDIKNGMLNSEICAKYNIERDQYVINMLARLRQKAKKCGSETIESVS